ncbi:MAG: tyrosine-type recombinase/integrase [Dehalococcoidia bacterium]|nr:tyrosine-type recombinase/integrase [Dehalococcoidia bacterium]
MVHNPKTSARVDTGRPTDYANSLTGFLLSKEVEQCSPLTLVYYQRMCGQFHKFLKTVSDSDLRHITRQHVEAHLLELRNRGCAPHTVRSSYTALRAHFNWCIAEERLKASPMRNIKSPKVPKVGKPFLADGAHQALQAVCPLRLFCGSRDAAVLEVFWTDGLRRAENWGLLKTDLEWERGRIRVLGKGARERYVPFMPTAKKAIHRYLSFRNDDYPQLWLTDERVPLTLHGFTQITKRLFDRAEMEVKDNDHIFRRTWAMRQLRAGIPIKQVQLVGGWESISVLEQYVRAMESEDAMSAKWA